MSKANLTADELRLALYYDPETGVFLRRVNSRRRPNQMIPTGCKTTNGYTAISLRGYAYTAHRLAWLYMTGAWPENDIDHIDGVRSNNQYRNLRDVKKSTNAQNRRRQSVYKSTGLPLGVTLKRVTLEKPYAATIRVDGRKKSLGYYRTPEDAHQVYLAAKREHHQGCTI